MRLSTLSEEAIASTPKRKRALFQSYSVMSLIFLLFLGITGINAQETVVDIFDLPEPERCVSNDLRVVEASLDFDACGPVCEPGEIIEYPLTLAIFNNTGSLRTSFAFFARLEQYNPDGTLAATYFISGCKGPVPPNATTSITFDESLEILDQDGNPTSFEGVPYLCGGSLKLINLYEAWTDASDNDNRVCPLDPSTINPKCGVLPSIEIQTPINAFVEDVTNVSCFDGSDGAIDITVTGGVEPFTFVWSRVGGGFSASTEDVSGLSAGTYNVNITDDNGCPFSLEGIVVGQPPELQATQGTVADASCFGDDDGSISISVTGGTPPYTYAWTGPDGYTAATEDISGLEAGTYSVTVTDDNDCTDTLSGIIVDEPEELVATLDDSENASCFEVADGSIDISIAGGTPPYVISWTGPGDYASASEDISGLAAGTYSVTVTDDNDCTDVISGIIIEQPTEVIATEVSVTDASCAELSTGAIDISVVGGTPPYTYLWSNGATTQDLTAIGAGTYSVTVTDFNGCEDTLEGIEVDDPAALEVTATTVTDVSCFEGDDGAINITVTGGTTPYTFLWSNGAITEDVTGLEAGTYSVTVTDDNDCSTELTGIIVDEPEELIATLDDSDDATCFDLSDGSISISIAGGTPPYVISWTGTGGYTSASEDISGLAAGTYSVTVTDDNDCTDEITGILIGQPDELVATVVAITDASCAGFLTGAIDISVEGGTSPYTYLWSNGATTQDLNGVGAGSYSVTVTDENGCQDVLNGIEVDDPSTLEATIQAVTDVSCFEAEDGAININVTGGTAPYSYAWTGPNGFSETTQDISGVGGGSYSVTITDDNECSVTLSGIIVDEPAELVVTLDDSEDATCFDLSDGSISISIAGGTPPYVISWTGTGGYTSASEDISGLAAGTYSVTVTDDNDCTDVISGIIIEEPTEVVAAVVSVTDATCAELSTGAIDISVEGGTPPYTYLWSNGATTQDLTAIGAGTYSVTVTDFNGCEDILDNIEVDDPSALGVTATTLSDVSCFEAEDGAINITVTGGTAPYTFLWSNGATTEDVSGLDAGTYSVTVTDDNDCTFTLGDLIIGEPTEVPAPQVVVAPADCFPTGGSFSIVDASGDLEYSLDGGDWFTYTGTISDVDPGAHSLRARDDNGCISAPLNFDVPQPFEVPTAPTVTATQPDCETLTGTIIVTSGTAGFRFSINGGDYVTYPVGGFSGLAPGDYTVRAQSLDGCISDLTNISLEVPECDDFEGCTLGYWKNHTDRWCDTYLTCDIYGEIFPGAPSQLASLTLLEVLNLGGGGIYNLGRQSVAALLNACSDEVDYELETTQDVIDYVTANFGNAGAAGSHLDMLNNAGCTLGGSKATKAASEECRIAASPAQTPKNGAKAQEVAFSVFPVPFKDELNIRYEFDYKSDALIQIFDVRGNLVKSQKESKASSGKTTTINADFVRGQQMYLVKVTTNRGTFVKSVISGK